MNLPELEKHITPFSYRGDANALTRIWLKNLVLGILTLGIYWAWGRVHTRRYVWAHIFIGDAPLVWTGTFVDQRNIASPSERGLSAAFFIRALPTLLGRLFGAQASAASVWFSQAQSLLGLCVYPMFQLASRRFQLGHTHYQDICFGHTGRLGAYAKLYIKHALWAGITLGYGYADFAVATRQYMVNHGRYGDVHASYTGNAAEVRRYYIVGTIASLLTLGAYFPWHIAKLRNYHLNRTALGHLKCISTQEGSTLSNLWAFNIFILIGTLGLGYALTRTRSMHYQLNHLALEGDLTTLVVNPGAPQTCGGLVDLLSLAGDDMLGA